METIICITTTNIAAVAAILGIVLTIALLFFGENIFLFLFDHGMWKVYRKILANSDSFSLFKFCKESECYVFISDKFNDGGSALVVYENTDAVGICETDPNSPCGIAITDALFGKPGKKVKEMLVFDILPPLK